MIIRYAKIDDLQGIVNIYNQAVKSGDATADLDELTVDDKRAWFIEHDNNYPICIVEDNNKTIGWGSLSPYRKGRKALKHTAEISYYIDYRFHRLGYGKKLIDYMIKDCDKLGIKNLFALLLEVNTSSATILEGFGFEKWGLMPNVVNLPSTTCGHLIYGLNLY